MISSPFDQSVSIYVISDIQITIIDVLSQYTHPAEMLPGVLCEGGSSLFLWNLQITQTPVIEPGDLIRDGLAAFFFVSAGFQKEQSPYFDVGVFDLFKRGIIVRAPVLVRSQGGYTFCPVFIVLFHGVPCNVLYFCIETGDLVFGHDAVDVREVQPEPSGKDDDRQDGADLYIRPDGFDYCGQ